MEFEIDVSGEDILAKDYSICIANKTNIIKGFKFDEKLLRILCSKFGQGFYRYKKSSKENTLFKVRIYCIVIYYLLENLHLNEDLSLIICRDFDGKENDIKENLRFLLGKKLGLKLNSIIFLKLNTNSNAHKYASLMREDKNNLLSIYININLKDFEKWLIK